MHNAQIVKTIRKHRVMMERHVGLTPVMIDQNYLSQDSVKIVNHSLELLKIARLAGLIHVLKLRNYFKMVNVNFVEHS